MKKNSKRANGEGNLRQRSNGTWQLSVMIGRNENGQKIVKYFTGHTQKEAKTKFLEYMYMDLLLFL